MTFLFLASILAWADDGLQELIVVALPELA
jgi:hypothetical protein